MGRCEPARLFAPHLSALNLLKVGHVQEDGGKAIRPGPRGDEVMFELRRRVDPIQVGNVGCGYIVSKDLKPVSQALAVRTDSEDVEAAFLEIFR